MPKSVWQSNQNPHDLKLVITESAIDALSYQQLFAEANTRYLATGGSLSAAQRGLIQSIFAAASNEGLEIVIATDNDEGGEKLKEELVKLAPNDALVARAVPGDDAVDWNELLKAQQEEERRIQQSQLPKGRGGFSL